VPPDLCRRWLVWLLRGVGGLALCAFLAVALPTSWMALLADRLGVGPLPRSPLVEYLTRSLSALYGLSGVLLLHLARDVQRHADLLVLIGRVTVGFGAILTVVDFAAGMPAAWSWGEGPGTLLLGAVLVGLARRVRAD